MKVIQVGNLIRGTHAWDYVRGTDGEDYYFSLVRGHRLSPAVGIGSLIIIKRDQDRVECNEWILVKG